MEWVLAIVFGLMFAAGGKAGLVKFALGAALGWLLGRVVSQESRIALLERRLESLRDRETTRETAGRDDKEQIQPANEKPVSPAPQTTSDAKTSPAAMLAESRKYEKPVDNQTPPQPVSEARNTHGVQPAVAQYRQEYQPASAQAAYDWRSNAVMRWLLSGNIPVKVGVLVSFFGVAFLLKYAVEQGWMRLPIELRLLGVASFGAGLLYLGWRLRESHRVYALSVQGGGIGILYLTTYSALRLFHVLPPSATFACLVLIAAGAGWLAVHQNARALAVLGSVGGFLAPLLASTGSGSHVALFTYYLILNIGIAGVAAFRHWRMLNLLGFVFTFGIGLIWGAQYYQPRYFASVEPFLIAHFLLYTAIAVFSAMKHSFRLQGYVDSALVFGLPLVAFPLQAALVDGESMPLAWTASVLAGFYAVLSRWLEYAGAKTLRLLSQTYLALAIIFATLAVPLWLDAPWVANTWALEAAAMIAIGLKQRRVFTHWAGVLLLAAAAFSYFASLETLAVSPLLLSERFLGGFVLCAALSFCAWIYAHDGETVTREIPMDWFTGATAWFGWLLLAHGEIFEHAVTKAQPAFSLLAIAMLSFVLERATARWVPMLRVLAISILPLLFVHVFWWPLEFSHYLAAWGWVAWPAGFAMLIWTLHRLPRLRSLLLTGMIWIGAIWLGVEVNYLLSDVIQAGGDWNELAVLLVLLSYALAADRAARHIYPADFDERIALLPLFVPLLVFVASWHLISPGRFAPLPYLPLLNPQFLASAGFAFAAWKLFRTAFTDAPWLKLAGGFAFYLVTLEIARGTHHLGGVAFAANALWHSGSFQAALSIIWSLLGIAGMVAGAKFTRRRLWMSGAALMAVVVAKLFLVDLGNSGSLTRVISFIGVGLLLLVVGYLAPVPATARQEGEQAQ